MESSVLYFAYGSNLHLDRIRARVPSATPVAIGYVKRRKLAFHKRSVDGSSKADAIRTRSDLDRVWGAVYRVHSSEKPSLDRHEFLGIGYDQEQVEVFTERGSAVKAWMYVARKQSVDASLKPYRWYVQYVIRGAYGHRLPMCYIATLHRVHALVDPDAKRLKQNWRLLGDSDR